MSAKELGVSFVCPMRHELAHCSNGVWLCLLRAILASLLIAITCILLSLVRYVRAPEDIGSSAPSHLASLPRTSRISLANPYAPSGGTRVHARPEIFQNLTHLRGRGGWRPGRSQDMIQRCTRRSDCSPPPHRRPRFLPHLYAPTSMTTRTSSPALRPHPGHPHDLCSINHPSPSWDGRWRGPDCGCNVGSAPAAHKQDRCAHDLMDRPLVGTGCLLSCPNVVTPPRHTLPQQEVPTPVLSPHGS
ncbi:hypothetical protein FIBSPDRAFT_450121 [Athelia psychrophila]|uniref:Uncharacterized protein n=1 Tax=Athelia psychrophila TaxID=1759441 RepID=A0A166M258_9AGAM|nr:hypothetical protein FIBSPDRAFT_450121 [Fibularhizoctonia sp. CBS 109695]